MTANAKNSICVVGTHYYKCMVGGAEVQMYLIAKQFLDRGWDVHYVTTDVSEKSIDEGIILHPYRPRGVFNNSYEDLSRILGEIDADVYYQRGRAFHPELFARFARERSKPYILAVSMDIDCRRYKNLPRVFERRGKNLARKLAGAIKAYWIDRTSLRGMQAASLVLCQTLQQHEMLKRNLGIDSQILKNMHCIPNVEEIKKSDPPIVLWLASLKRWKQPELFIRLAEKLQHLDCRFVLAGRMSDSYYREIIQDALARINNLEYIQNVSFEKSNELIAEASVFLNTSLPNEGFPNTFIQAWLRKVPTVSLNFNPDQVIEKHSLGYHSKDFENLIADVAKLITDKQRRIRMGEAARKYAVKEFDLENNFEILYNTVNKLLRSNDRFN